MGKADTSKQWNVPYARTPSDITFLVNKQAILRFQISVDDVPLQDQASDPCTKLTTIVWMRRATMSKWIAYCATFSKI
jgi:hypothetical protein